MATCPNCRDPMASRSLEGYGTLAPIDVDACAACGLFWFDRHESIRFTPRAVLELFRFIGGAGPPRHALGSRFACPRCQSALQLTHDLQRTTRFTYWRCGLDGGQLMTFGQFLRAKNFVRAPTPAELAHLRATVRQVSCSQCGAPIDLAADSACAHCGAPVALLDPDGIARTVAELGGTGQIPNAADPASMRARLSEAQLAAIADVARTRPPDRGDDLVSIGSAAIGALLDVLCRP